jgi:3-oxoacyl-[acyl-carrier-protein] synthase II
MPSLHDVCITGYGLLSALPEEKESLWQALNHFSSTYSTVNASDFAPYSHHPLVNYAIEQQIVKHSDRRVMGAVMQSAVYTAGVALDQAQLKNQPELLQDTQIIVALRGGERDDAADQAITATCHVAREYRETLNAGLMAQLRPTLFLSQLPNLLAANIALLYGTVGSSVTLMGGEIGGAQAIQLACARIESGQAQRILVGGVCINATQEIINAYGQAQKLLTTPFVPLWERTQEGLYLGSASGFLILESQHAAKARNVPILGKLSHCHMQNNVVQSLTKTSAILSMTHNLIKALALQQQHPESAVRAMTTAMGTIFEAAMPVGLILALECLSHKKLFAPLDFCGFEKTQASVHNLNKLWVHCSGQTYGEAWACLEAI